MSSTGTSNNKPEKVRGGVNFYVFFWSFVSLLRIAIGFHPHSGQDNHHGSANKGAYGGDFEGAYQNIVIRERLNEKLTLRCTIHIIIIMYLLNSYIFLLLLRKPNGIGWN